MMLCYPLQLIPEYRDFIWGGTRLRPGQLTAEAWVVFGTNRIAHGPLTGRTLAEIASEHPTELMGERVVGRTGSRFPLLIKILDCAQWLSLQVHPDDVWAARLEGPGHYGKTEAWHVLDAKPDARLIAGTRPGTTAEALADAIREGAILDWVHVHRVGAGDTIFMPARTIHALGPGLLIYEAQQASDITYRVFDWGRPPTAGRALHIDKSLAVADPGAAAAPRPAPALADGERANLVACPYFDLELITGDSRPIRLDTAGQTFHALTVIEGSAEIACTSPRIDAQNATPITLRRFDSAVVPAACGLYLLRTSVGCKVLKASVE